VLRSSHDDRRSPHVVGQRQEVSIDARKATVEKYSRLGSAGSKAGAEFVDGEALDEFE